MKKKIIDITATLHEVQIYSTVHDYDISGAESNGIYRAKVPVDIKKGDYFNVYCFESTKLGCKWNGDLISSLYVLVNSDAYKQHQPGQKKFFIIITGKLAKAVQCESIEKVRTDYIPHMKGSPTIHEITNIQTLKNDLYNITKRYS